jgi:glycosyltransferase involved in cell wall biosynthesis
VKLSVCIITLNEEANIGRTLKSVQPLVADGQGEIIVVDSGSTDKTVEIAKSYGAKVFTEPWKGFAAQKNSALEKAQGEWILSLDADEEVSSELASEIERFFSFRAEPVFPPELLTKLQALGPDEKPGEELTQELAAHHRDPRSVERHNYMKALFTRQDLREGFRKTKAASKVEGRNLEDGSGLELTAFSVPRQNHFLGRWIQHGGFYPDRKLRFFQKRSTYFKPSQRVHETAETSGVTATFSGHLIHHAYPTLSGYIEHMNKYSSLGAEMEIEKGRRGFSLINIVVRPWLTFVYNYFFRLGFLDGKEGLLLHMYHAVYVSWKYAKVWELSRAEAAPKKNAAS